MCVCVCVCVCLHIVVVVGSILRSTGASTVLGILYVRVQSTERFPCSFLLRPTGINDSLGSWILYQNTSQPASNPIIDRSEREESDLP